MLVKDQVPNIIDSSGKLTGAIFVKNIFSEKATVISRNGCCDFSQRRKEEKGAEVVAVSLRLF